LLWVIFHSSRYSTTIQNAPVKSDRGIYRRASNVPFRFVHEGSIGGADIRFVFGVGLLVGFSSVITIFIYSTVFTLLVFAASGLIQRHKITSACNIPYIPFLMMAYTANRLWSYFNGT
jgi:Flp pilus assembly protein protease CpaA